MKKLLGSVGFVALLASPFALATENLDDHWYNRPNVIRAAQTLATEVEHLDEALHDAKAPAHFIQKVHHFEETVVEFVDLVKSGFSYQQAMSEFNHIREDVRMITDEFNAHPHLLQYPKVSTEWRMMKLAYRRLDHEMYAHKAERNTPELLKQLEDEALELERH